MILRCADRPYRAWTDESEESLRRSRQLSSQQRRESRHSRTAALGQQPTSGLLGVARRSAPGASYSAQPLADQPMPPQQLHEPRLGLLDRYVTALDQPFQPVYFGKKWRRFLLEPYQVQARPIVFDARGHSS